MKVLIADDEQQIRMGLREGIPWESLGFEPAFVAEDGEQALRLFIQHSPELVITDIRMPGLDGLALAAAIRERADGTQIVLVSGHSDFEYAKRALQLGVTDYLLKPVKFKELLSLIDSVRTRILSSAQERKVNEWAIWSRVFRGESLDSQLTVDLMRSIRGKDSRTAVWCAVVAPDDIQDFELLELVTEVSIGATLVHHDATLVWALGVSDSTTGPSLPLDLSRRASMCWIANIRDDLVAAINRCREGLRHRLYLGPSARINASEIETDVLAAFAEGRARDNFVEVLKSGTVSSFLPLASQCFDLLTERRETDERVVEKLVRDLLEILEKHLALPTQEPPTLVTIAAYRNWTLRHCEALIRESTGINGTLVSPLILRTLSFVRSHLAENLSIDRVAAEVKKSPNYFSYLFKKELGVSFIDYVNRARVFAAKELMKTSTLLAYEIAERVGYRDYRYFVQVFKKLEGIAPSEFRKS